MDEQTWTDVDAYIEEQAVGTDEELAATLRASGDLPNIAVSAPQGKFLHLFARAIGARRILEVGTLGGYSGIWLARALPDDGLLVTCEVNARHAEVARRNFEQAGVAARVDVRVGAALDTLAALEHDAVEPFDLAFIDADKPPTAEYFDHAVRLLRPGGVVLVDNVVRGGKLIDAGSDDPAVQGMRRFLASVRNDARVTVTVLQTVGVKGYDGFAVALVKPR